MNMHLRLKQSKPRHGPDADDVISENRNQRQFEKHKNHRDGVDNTSQPKGTNHNELRLIGLRPPT